MCGIAGIMMKDGSSPDNKILDSFIKTLSHRGPDGDGKHIATNIGLIQTRLAIIDLETGDQPLYDKNGVALVGNGEIYNYLEIKQDLSEYDFQTKSDCECALALYNMHGVDYAKYLRGMFALAIHDPAAGQLVISRDPFGIKPLYYIENDEYFAFASEAQALIKSGLVNAKIDNHHRNELLQLQFTCRSGTIYQGISRLLPGETIIIKAGHIVERKKIPALPTGSPEKITEQDAMQRLDKALYDSVKIHQRSDVPYGLFLSGGIDSSVLLAIMAELNNHPVIAFTAGFSNSTTHDERDHARMLAKSVNAEHHEIEFGEDDFWQILPKVAAIMDDPAADYAILPTWKLAKEASKDLKVVLCGEGGDELLAGYGRYRSVMRPWWLGGRTMRHRGCFDGLNILRDDSKAWRDAILAQEVVSDSDGRNILQIAQAIDCADWLSNDLLIKLDRCLMAHGLEGRTPFLDIEVAKASFLLPDNLKINKRLGKWILRKWLNKKMPQAKAFEKKRGFSVPVGQWINNDGNRVGKLLANLESIKEIAHPDKVIYLFNNLGKRQSFAAWSLLFYALWHRANIEGIDPKDGNLFDILEMK